MILHGYWRSGTAYRTRIALNLKGLAYDQAGVDLRKGEQKSAAYLALNPQGLVPALETRPTPGRPAGSRPDSRPWKRLSPIMATDGPMVRAPAWPIVI